VKAQASDAIYLQRTYLAESIDPIHIGTGEFQLGRVDNTIVRESGTELPKIPGSSIAGVCRAYSAMIASKYLSPDNKNSCAGKGGPAGEKHCGRADCPVCTAFGFSKRNASFQGLAQFSDLRILFFPVYSATGPLWVTCPAALDAAGITSECGSLKNSFADLGDCVAEIGSSLPSAKSPDSLNLGWLYLKRFSGVVPPSSSWKIATNADLGPLDTIPYIKFVLPRLTVVSDHRFPAIVNDQLEIRTSVSIAPETGAAEDGALFTAEAIPRACFFSFNVTYLNPDNYRVPPKSQPIQYGDSPAQTSDVEKIVTEALHLAEFLGIGGVNTRGMGRLRVIDRSGHHAG